MSLVLLKLGTLWAPLDVQNKGKRENEDRKKGEEKRRDVEREEREVMEP